ncbi:MAG: ROK family transcriptional regulator, partial [Planctomycetota bacterium]
MSSGLQQSKQQRRRNAVLARVRRHPGTSRQQLAEALHTSTYSMSTTVREMVEQRLLVEGEPIEGGAIGRPSVPLEVNPEVELTAGVDIEAEAWRLVLMDFAGGVVYRHEQPMPGTTCRDDVVQALTSMLKRRITSCRRRWPRVASLGVAAPGFIDHEAGIVEQYNMVEGFERIPLRDLYATLTGLPTTLAWNIRCLARWDQWQRQAVADRVTLCVAVRSGIGAVLFEGADVFRGSHKLAGELGLFPLDDGVLEQRIGMRALARQVTGLPRGFTRGVPEAIERAWAKPAVRRELTDRLHDLARVLAGLCTMLD